MTETDAPVLARPLREIPVIDIAPFRDGTGGAAVAAAVARACESIGFFVITGHGIAGETLEHLTAQSRAFFDLPETQKTRIRRHGTNFGGPTYVPLNSESLGALDGTEGQADLKESLDLAPRHLGDAWCAGTETLQAAWAEAFVAYDALAADLRALFCTAAGVAPDTLEPAFQKHASSVRSLNYPEVRGVLKAGQVRAGTHTDYSAFTVIRGDDAPGLQVRALDGTWIDVPAIPGSFVVNIGDLLMRWTNDRWISTPHRVVTLADTEISPRRQSIAFFHNPGAHAVIECLAPFRPAKGQPKYPPVTYQAYAQDKFRAQVGDPTLELPIDGS
ncbi:MAG: 2-oxoglutarate and iron-dependent oxygenase domain-containing protein [Pseudomonadota bacterium]